MGHPDTVTEIFFFSVLKGKRIVVTLSEPMKILSTIPGLVQFHSCLLCVRVVMCTCVYVSAEVSLGGLPPFFVFCDMVSLLWLG